LFVEPLNIVQLGLTLEDIPKSSRKWKVFSSLLLVIRKYVGGRIQKRIDLIQEIWELIHNFTIFGTKITHFKEYL